MKQQSSSLVYRLKQIPELDNLRVKVEAHEGNLKCEINGKISPFLRILISRFFTSHSSLGTLATVNGSNVYSLYFPPIPSLAHERLFETFLSTYVFNRPKPMAATIGVTKQCQYRCAHCSAAGRSYEQPDMNTEEIKKVIEGCLAGNFQFHITSGGELTPCDFTPLSFGNIRESSVPELWQKLLSHPAYSRRSLRCRMQDPEFRRKYIETIPEGKSLPYRQNS